VNEVRIGKSKSEEGLLFFAAEDDEHAEEHKLTTDNTGER